MIIDYDIFEAISHLQKFEGFWRSLINNYVVLGGEIAIHSEIHFIKK